MNVASLPSHFKILLNQTAYHCRLLIRMPRGIFSAFLAPVLVLVALRYLIPDNTHLTKDTLFLIAGPITMGVVMTAYDSHAAGLLTARASGVLKRLHGAPLPSWCYFVGRIIATVLISVVSSLAVLFVARGLYSFNLSPQLIFITILTIALGAVAWAAIGTAVTRFLRDSSGQTILSAMYLPLLFLSGTFSSFAQEPRWIQTLAKFFPAQPISQSLGSLLTGSHLSALPFTSYLVLLVWAAIGTFAAVMTFRWE